MSKWIKDMETGKEWGPISEKRMTWNEAQEWAKKQGGRVAKRWELVQLCDEWPEEIVGPMRDKNFWSSSSYVNDTDYAWYVGFGYGFVNYDFKVNYLYARCVR